MWYRWSLRPWRCWTRCGRCAGTTATTRWSSRVRRRGAGALSAATVAGEVGRSGRRGVASRLALDVPHVGIGARGRGLRGDGNESVACGRLGCRTELFAVDVSGQAPGAARRMVRVPCRRRRGHRRGRPRPAYDNTAVSAQRMFRSECCNLRWRCSGPHLGRANETLERRSRRSLSLGGCVTPNATSGE